MQEAECHQRLTREWEAQCHNRIQDKVEEHQCQILMQAAVCHQQIQEQAECHQQIQINRPEERIREMEIKVE
jgi:hypothetical protein